MRAQLLSTVKIVARVLGIVLIVLLTFRIYKSQTGIASAGQDGQSTWR
jgi:hypothetical protein